MAKRSSVKVLAAAMPQVSETLNESRNVEIRKIDNGYIKRESTWKGDDYQCTEVFSREKPDLDDDRRANAGASSLRDAVKALK